MSTQRCPLLVLLSLLVVADWTGAQTVPAATQAHRYVVGSPEDVVASFIVACQAGDVKDAKRVAMRDAKADRFIDVLAGWSQSIRALEEAAIERWGDEGRGASGYPPEVLTATANPNGLESKIDGDRATVSYPLVTAPYRLVHINGQWKIDLSETVRDPRITESVRHVEPALKVAIAVTAEIREGKFASPAEARDSFTQRRLEAVNGK